MAEKKFRGAPFGTQLMRFDVSGIYPALKKTGTYTEIPYCKTRTTELERNLGPGRYDVDTGDFSARVLQKRAKGPGWRRAQEVAWLANVPHVLYEEAWEHKRFLLLVQALMLSHLDNCISCLAGLPVCGTMLLRPIENAAACLSLPNQTSLFCIRGETGCLLPAWLLVMVLVCTCQQWNELLTEKSKVGPGSYRIADFMELLQKRPRSVRGVCESREERFKSLYAQNETPGPGSYGKGGIPSAVLDEKRMQLTGTCPTMDFGPTVERLLEPKRDCGVGPGTYNLKTSIDVLLNRRWDHKSIPSGHLPDPKTSNVDPGEEIRGVSSFVEELDRPEKRKHGLFSRMCRNPECPTERIYHSTLAQCPRPASFPGPGWYTVRPLSGAVNRDPPPFQSSAPRNSERAERLQSGNHNNRILGPGTYNIAKKDQQTTLHSHHSAFKSRTQRYLHNPERDKFNQERLQPIHFPVNKGSYLKSQDTSTH